MIGFKQLKNSNFILGCFEQISRSVLPVEIGQQTKDRLEMFLHSDEEVADDFERLENVENEERPPANDKGNDNGDQHTNDLENIDLKKVARQCLRVTENHSTKPHIFQQMYLALLPKMKLFEHGVSFQNSSVERAFSSTRSKLESLYFRLDKSTLMLHKA